MEKIENIRQETKDRLVRMIKAEGSLLNAHIVAVFLGYGFTDIYRWVSGTALWLPALEKCTNIDHFLDAVEELRRCWPEYIRGWDKLPETFKLAFFPKAVRRIVEDGSLSTAEKTEELTIRVLRILRRQILEEEAPDERTE